MNRPLDELYFEWLYSHVCSVKRRNPSRTYWSLLRLLFTKEFVWFIPNDDNRAEDGLDLRDEFLADMRIRDPDPNWMNLGCSMLEMLIGLARRLSFEDGADTQDWFWELMDNLGLRKYNDREGLPNPDAEDIIDSVIWRQYNYDGTGGLFPLSNPERDQRKVELWYQLSAYLLERT